MTGTWYVSTVIRTKTENQHGLLLTKPLHHSQKETQTFGEHDGLWYGEVTLTIEPNRERAPNVERADKGSYKETDGTIHRRITKI